MTQWTSKKARDFLNATFADIGDEEGLVVMPRSLFEFIAQNLGVKLPETQIMILNNPPKLTLTTKED